MGIIGRRERKRSPIAVPGATYFPIERHIVGQRLGGSFDTGRYRLDHRRRRRRAGGTASLEAPMVCSVSCHCVLRWEEADPLRVVENRRRSRFGSLS